MFPALKEGPRLLCRHVAPTRHPGLLVIPPVLRGHRARGVFQISFLMLEARQPRWRQGNGQGRKWQEASRRSCAVFLPSCSAVGGLPRMWR